MLTRAELETVIVKSALQLLQDDPLFSRTYTRPIEELQAGLRKFAGAVESWHGVAELMKRTRAYLGLSVPETLRADVAEIARQAMAKL